MKHKEGIEKGGDSIISVPEQILVKSGNMADAVFLGGNKLCCVFGYLDGVLTTNYGTVADSVEGDILQQWNLILT